MLLITDDKTINLTRGDIASIEISANQSDTLMYTFKTGDVIRFTVVEKNKCENVVLQKDFFVESESSTVDVFLSSMDTKIGEFINKPKDYWYEVVLNPDTAPQTIIGYDLNGPKIFRLFPEGDDVNEYLG